MCQGNILVEVRNGGLLPLIVQKENGKGKSFQRAELWVAHLSYAKKHWPASVDIRWLLSSGISLATGSKTWKDKYYNTGDKKVWRRGVWIFILEDSTKIYTFIAHMIPTREGTFREDRITCTEDIRQKLLSSIPVIVLWAHKRRDYVCKNGRYWWTNSIDFLSVH